MGSHLEEVPRGVRSWRQKADRTGRGWGVGVPWMQSFRLTRRLEFWGGVVTTQECASAAELYASQSGWQVLATYISAQLLKM